MSALNELIHVMSSEMYPAHGQGVLYLVMNSPFFMDMPDS